jgi:hypothetical protein
MSVSNRRLCETFNQWKNFNHVINFLLKLLVSSPLLEWTW